MSNMIFKRTSVRKYLDTPVTQEQLELLLKAGMAAPSACNAQPWELIAVKKRETLLKITQIHPHSFMLKEAPLAIVVCADTTKVPAKVPDVEFWPQDCAAVTENIMLQAAEMGLGTVWMGVFPRKDVTQPIAELFELPSNVKPFSIIAVGTPGDEVMPKDKFDQSKIHYEKW